MTGGGSATDLATDALRQETGRLLDLTADVLADVPDAVHQARVSTRRVRALLRAFRPWLDRERVDELRAELAAWGRVLGVARDLEVERDRAAAMLDDLPDELVVGPVRARVTAELDATRHAAHTDVVVHLGTERHAQLVVALRQFSTLADDRSTACAEDAAARVVRRAWRRARDREREARAVLASTTGTSRWPSMPDPVAQDRDLAAALHELRKASRTARYVAEAVALVASRPAERFAAAFEDVQDVLGEHHDAVIMQGVVRAMGMRAHLAGENGFTYGLLAGLERDRAARALAAFPAAWHDASRRRVRRWAT